LNLVFRRDSVVAFGFIDKLQHLCIKNDGV